MYQKAGMSWETRVIQIRPYIASGYGIVFPLSGKDLLLSNHVVVHPYILPCTL